MTTINKKIFAKYLLFSFLLAWIFQVIASILVLNGSSGLFTILLSISMYAPGLAVLISFKSLKEEVTGIKWKPNFKGNIYWWVISWILPVVIILLGCAFYFLTIPERFDPTASSYLTGVMGAQAYETQRAGMDTITFIAINIINVLLGGIFNTIFAIGEEAGWRGYMTPTLKTRFGKTKGRLLAGLIWGIWHWPVMILAGYEYGWSIFNAPLIQVLIGLFLFLIFTTIWGIILDWLYTKSETIWAPALAHGMINGCASIGLILTKFEYASSTALGPLPIGLVSCIPALIIAIVILIREE